MIGTGFPEAIVRRAYFRRGRGRGLLLFAVQYDSWSWQIRPKPTTALCEQILLKAPFAISSASSRVLVAHGKAASVEFSLLQLSGGTSAAPAVCVSLLFFGKGRLSNSLKCLLDSSPAAPRAP